MAGQAQRWGYVQPQQHYQQHQLGRSDSIVSAAGLDQSSAALELLANSTTTTFTAAVSVTTANSSMLPSLSSSSSSSSSSMSDSDAALVMETVKIDPLDLTCNSHQTSIGRSNGPAAATASAGQHARVTDSSLADKSSSSAARNMLLFNNDCDMDQPRNRTNNNNNNNSTSMMSTTTGAIGPALPAGATATSSNGASAEEAHRCDMCGKTFAVPARLTRHYRTHTGERPFVCEVCGKSFSVKENLSVHRRIHTKEKPYRCPHCGRGFEHSGKLHRHMRIHTGERPHQCSDCGKTFIQSGQLVIHMRSHTGEKPYVCNVCNKGFTCSKQLKVHSRTHTGERPYACDVCGKTFAYNHVLKLHQMAHLGERLYKCTICSETYSSKKTLEAHIKMHGVSPTRQSPVPSTSSSSSVSSVGNIQASNRQTMAMAASEQQQQQQQQQMARRQGRHFSSGGIFIEQPANNKRIMATHPVDSGERGMNQPSSSPSSAESSRSSPSDLDGLLTGPAPGNNLLMEAQRHFPVQQHPTGMAWNMLNGLTLSRQHPLTQAQFDDSQQSQQPHASVTSINLQERTGSSFAYPQLLNATRDRLAGLPVAAIDPKNLRHNFGGQQQQHPSNQQLKQNSTNNQSTERDYSPMTYLRPMPPLIPVTVTGPIMAASPPSLRSFERLGSHSSLESSAVVPRQLDGSSTTRGPPRKSSRFRGGEGSGSAGDNGCESSDSPTSSASSSPSLMTDVMVTDGQSAPIADSLRSTSVIRFAHRPCASSSPTSSK